MKTILILFIIVSIIFWDFPFSTQKIELSQQEIAKSAQEFLNSLTTELRTKAVFPFQSEERFNWTYLPGRRKGVSIKDMSQSQRDLAYNFLITVLSEKGYTKAKSIMELEQTLREIEKLLWIIRDPELYWFTFFGTPSDKTPWSFRVEGHHLSINFCSITNKVVTITPTFMGANPAHVQNGPKTDLRVLKNEEDLARQLLNSLDPSQLKKAIIMKDAPNDIITGTDRKANPGKPVGLLASEMNKEQQELLTKLIEVYVYNFRNEFAELYIKRIKNSEIENLHFAWAGGTEKGQKHYYRIHGPTLLIEYDNTQNNANHIHTVFRDLENDFGIDMLRRHYEESNHHLK